MTTCEFALLPCPKECKDDSDKVKQFMRKDLDKHLEEDCPNRDYSCEHCGEKGTYASITKVHDKVCLKKPIHCANDCGSTVQRQLVEEHLATECELTVIACKYKRLGCDRELKRKNMAAHEEDDKLHLRMAMDTTAKLTNDIVELQDACKVLKGNEPIKFEVTKYQKKKESYESTDSPSYYISPNGYHVALRVYANGNGDGAGTHVSVFAMLLKGRKNAKLKSQFIGEVTFTLLNQLEDKNHHQTTLTLTAAHNTRVGDNWGNVKFIPHSELDFDAVNNTQYLKDDSLYFRMSVDNLYFKTSDKSTADHKPWLQ